MGIRKDSLTEKSVDLKYCLEQIEVKVSSFIEMCGKSPSAQLLGGFTLTLEEQDLLDAPLTTESAEGEPTPRQMTLNPMESSRSRNKSPTKLKLREVNGS